MYIQADWKKDKWPIGCEHHCFHLWHWINLIFAMLFSVELVLRLLAHGCWGFFVTSPDIGWNIFDFTIVLLGLLDVLLRAFKPIKLGHKNFIAIARCLRVLRILRVVRLLKTFRQLRLLARGLVESVNAVFWIFFLVVFLIYIYAIFFTDIINHQSDLWEGEKRDQIEGFFGSVPLTMFTLFQFVTLDGWTDVDALVMEKMQAMQIGIFSFIVIESFVILSLLTGVMADHMDQVRKDEDNELLKHNQGEVDLAQKAFKRIFQKGKGPAYLTKKEFGMIFADRRQAAELNVEDVELTGIEAIGLFDIFDKDCDGKLVWSEFQSGINDYRKGLTALQIMQLKSILQTIDRQVRRSPDGQLPGKSHRQGLPGDVAEAELAKTEVRLAELDRRLGKFDKRVKDMMSLYTPKSGGSSRKSHRRSTSIGA
mmetsp:Transcript_115550/g.359883  ORF Transcript_115550/g.359883 Transcript_115550/m.359883 type:complete len:424 (-) Transcript_115550:87-1358(-)